MNSFRQHIPGFARDGREPPEPLIPFETTADLLALEVVQRYVGPTFSHFAMSENCLMVIADDGFTHWVVGFIKDPASVDLPQWTGWKHLVRLHDGREVVLTDEVVSACGGRLTLRDGTEAVDVRFERQMAKQAADSAKRDAGICPRCDAPYATAETPDSNGSTRIDWTCHTCGGRMTSWRPKGLPVIIQDGVTR